MARVNNLSNFLTDVASAIKTKKGSETAIPAANFDTEILALPSQGVYQTKVITINENGQTVITPDSGYDAMDGVQVTTLVPEKQLQTKTYNFTTNQTIQLIPDTGYDGFDIVTLNINVDPNAVNYQIYTAAYIGQNNTIQRDSTRYATYKQIEIDLLPYINRTIIITNTGDRNFYGFTSVKPEGEVALNNPRQSTSGRLTYKYTGGNDRYLVYDFTTSNQSDSVINVELASAELIEKNITANGVYDAEDDDADGFSKVTVNVPSSQINNQDKTITQNGTYTADSGYTGLGEVTVNVPSGSGDVKLFDTVEHMQADSTAQEGDLAVVYREEIQAVTEESEFSSCIFPNEVVLDEAFSDDVYGSFRSTGSDWFDARINMSSSSFRFDGWRKSGNITVQYTSSDGITYTRTDGGEELQEFGTAIKWESWVSPFNNVIGNFMKIGGNYFEGLYEYVSGIHSYRLGQIKYVTIKDNKAIIDDTHNLLIFDKNIIVNLIDKCVEYVKNIENISIAGGDCATILIDEDNHLIVAYSEMDDTYMRRLRFVYDSSTLKYKCFQSEDSGTTSFVEYIFDIETSEYINKIEHTFEGTLNNLGITNVFDNYYAIGYYTDSNKLQNNTVWFNENGDYNRYGNIYEYKSNKYILADNQFTLSASNQLLPGIIALGNNGITVGNFGTNVSTAFNDDVAKIYTNVQIAYNNITPLVASDNNKRAGLSSDIILIPCKSDGTPLLDTSNVTDMSYTFNNCTSLTIIPLLDTSKATNMSGMFTNCTSLTTIPLLDTNKATDMSYMFSGCTSLTTIPLLDTSKATNMSYIFGSCTSLTTIPLLDTSKATNMNGMFHNCTLLEEIDLSGGTINSSATHNDIFYNVPTTCVIYVKDQASKTLLESWDNTHTYTIKTI